MKAIIHKLRGLIHFKKINLYKEKLRDYSQRVSFSHSIVCTILESDRIHGGHHLQMKKMVPERGQKTCSKTHNYGEMEHPRTLAIHPAHSNSLTHHCYLQGYCMQKRLRFALAFCSQIIYYLERKKQLRHLKLKWQEPFLIENQSKMKTKHL